MAIMTEKIAHELPLKAYSIKLLGTRSVFNLGP